MPTFTTTEMDGELRQSEILTGLVQFAYDPTGDEVLEIPHAFAIVLSQDCDLLWDYQARMDGGRRDLNSVLLYELEPKPDARARLPGSAFWRRIGEHREERYHELEEVPAAFDRVGTGLPGLIVDFKKFFTLTADEIYRQCAVEGAGGAKRRCRLDMPYREHLQTRLAFYLQRVALPERLNEAMAPEAAG